MTHLHPWTLRQQDAEEDHVHFVGSLRNSSTWETSLATWLEGNAISQESACYIGSCLSVYRVHPRDPNDDARSDEHFSDDKLVLTEAGLEKASNTWVGGRVADKRNEK